MSKRDSEFLKDRQDRIPADSETVGQILNPNRTEKTVRFPDPSLSQENSSNESQTPQSMADMVMARRTDAGRRETVESVVSKRRTTISLAIGIAILLVALAVLGWLWTY